MRRAALWALILLAVNGAYLAAFCARDDFLRSQCSAASWVGFGAGIDCSALCAPLSSGMRDFSGRGRGCFVSGVSRQHLRSALGVVDAYCRGRRGAGAYSLERCARSRMGRLAVSVCALLPIVPWPSVKARIENPPSAPLSMDLEGAGAHSPFAPSSAQTNTGKIIPSNFFMDSAGVRPLPQGHLRAVEKLHAPLRVLQ